MRFRAECTDVYFLRAAAIVPKPLFERDAFLVVRFPARGRWLTSPRQILNCLFCQCMQLVMAVVPNIAERRSADCNARDIPPLLCCCLTESPLELQ